MINDPYQMAAQAAGITAGNQLRNPARGRMMADAIRQSNTQLPGVTGQGYSAQGPTVLNALSTIIQQRQGKNRLAQMDHEAANLRGQMTQGQLAQLQSTHAQRQEDYQRRLNEREQDQVNRMALQNTKDVERKEEKDRLANQFTTNPKTWMNPETGEMVNVARKRGPGAWNIDDDVPFESKGFIEMSKQASKYYGRGRIDDLPASIQKDAIAAYEGLAALNDLNSMAKSFTPEEIAQLNQPGMDVAIKAATPQQFEQYVEKNRRNISPKVKDFLQRAHLFSTRIRHQYFGSALTATEASFAEAILPSAAGIKFGERIQRFDSFADEMTRRLDSIDRGGHRGLLAVAPKYQPYRTAEEKAATASDTIEAKKKRLEKLKKMRELQSLIDSGAD